MSRPVCARRGSSAVAGVDAATDTGVDPLPMDPPVEPGVETVVPDREVVEGATVVAVDEGDDARTTITPCIAA